MKKIILSLLVLLPFMVRAQSAGNDTTKYIYYQFTYGNALDRYWAKKVLLLPADTTYSKDGLAVKAGVLYVGNGVKWSLVTGGGGGLTLADTGYTKTLASIFLLQKTIDSTKLVNDARYRQLADSNKSDNSTASVGRLNKAKDSLLGILLQVKDSTSYATFKRLYKTLDSLKGVYLGRGDSTAFATFQRLYKVVDSLGGVFVNNNGAAKGFAAGLASARPSSTNSQNFYFSTDVPKLSYDGSGGWVDLVGGGGGGGGGTPPGSAKQVIIHSNNGNYYGTATNFTADSVTGLVNMDSATIHKVVLDSILLKKGMYNTPTGLCLLGDSYTAPSPVRPDGTSAYYFNIMNSRWGTLSVTNLASSGFGIWNAVAQFNKQTIPMNFITSALVDLNDLRFNNTALTFNKAISGWTAIYCLHFAASAIPATGGTGITNSGTWVSKDYTSGTYGGHSSSGAYTITQNSSITYTATLPSQGGSIYLMPMGGVSNYGAWSLKADTTIIQTGSSNQRTDGTQVVGHNDNFIDYGLIVNFSTGGSHSVTLTKTGATADTVGLDIVGVLKDSSTATPLLIWDQPLLDATGYAASPNQSSATLAAQMNAVHDSLYQTWDHRYPVKHVLTNNFWNINNSLAPTDHIHPNNQGDINLANAALDALPFNDPSQFRTLVKMGTTRFDILQNGKRRSILFKDEAVTKADLSIALLRANSGSVVGTPGTVAGFNSATTVGNTPITWSTNFVGINKATPTAILHMSGSNQGVWIESTGGATGAGGMGQFSNITMIGTNRRPWDGIFFNSSAASAIIQLTAGSGSGRIDLGTTNSNNTAATIWTTLFGNGHLATGTASPSDNGSWNANMVGQFNGGVLINGVSNAANKYNFVIQSNGQTVWANAGNTARFAAQIDSNRNAFRFGPNNPSNSYTVGYSWWDFTSGDFHDSAHLYVEDTVSLKARASYRTNLGASFQDNSLVDKHYVDSADAAHGGSGLADPGSNGILKRTALNTTAIASAGDFPTLNQNTTGTAAGITGLAVAGGRYLPTSSGNTNVNVLNIDSAVYMRIGNVVTVDICNTMSATAGAGANTIINFSLPITPSVVTTYCGMGTFVEGSGTPIAVPAACNMSGTSAVQCAFGAPNTTGGQYSFHFSYRIN